MFDQGSKIIRVRGYRVRQPINPLTYAENSFSKAILKVAHELLLPKHVDKDMLTLKYIHWDRTQT